MAYFYKNNAPRVNVKELKMKLRAEFREKRKSLSPEIKAEWDAYICQRLASLVSVRYAHEILSFSPLSGEVDVREFNAHAIKSGKSLYLPRCIAGTSRMHFHLIESLDSLNCGSYSIMEPPESAPVWQNETGKHSVCIIPAMSYDKNGYRLGYGKGFYDRYLSSKSTTKIGVCYTEFLSDNIPRGRYDLAVDIIVTEKGIITVKK